MQIISHRGYWFTPEERNKKVAFERSFNTGLGTETDLRDICGKIVISHDMPKGDEITFEEILQLLNGRNLPLALNIKADGLAAEIKRLLTKYNHTNYFTFDMSIPDMVVQLDNHLNVYTGLSDIMPNSILQEKATGVWLDSFYSDWFTAGVIDNLIRQGKKVCIVSADLHKRDVFTQWNIIRTAESFYSDNLMLCTDTPQKAKDFFND